ncbi:MAG: hypothetical protein M3P08_03070 [Thermoproteota archaeon]|nr:hypothetical protein [Thermoproteota archaeon]
MSKTDKQLLALFDCDMYRLTERHLSVSVNTIKIIVVAITLTTILTCFIGLVSAQTITATINPTNTFSMNGAISSLVLGMPPNTKTVDMGTVQKFILSGDWNMSVNKGNLTSFTANYYTGPADGGITNHTHQLSNFRVNNSNYVPIQLTPDKTLSISGILDVGTNGKKAWNDVHTTVVISKGRTISISLADKDTQSHFMGQQIYGIVKRLNIQ